MVDSWKYYLNRYEYPVKLSKYESADTYREKFEKDIRGDRRSTIEFEDYFRNNSKNIIDVYYEVVFWKYYSQPMFRQRGTSRIIQHVENKNIQPHQLHEALEGFTKSPNTRNLDKIRALLGIKTNVLAVPLTLVAFFQPSSFPMIDNVVAKWVNQNYQKHNEYTKNKLTPFFRNYTSLRDNDFQNFLNWMEWCNEVARYLSDITETLWRPRDVEMAVFTYERLRKKQNNIRELNQIKQSKRAHTGMIRDIRFYRELAATNHPLHLKIGDIFQEVFSDSLVKDTACGGDQHIPLFVSTEKSRKTEYCNVDLLVLKDSTVQVIVEIEESNIKPSQVTGKFLSPALSKYYIHRKTQYNPVRMAEDVTFIQFVDTIKLKGDRTSKIDQFSNIEESINKILPLKNSNITRYRLISTNLEKMKNQVEVDSLKKYLRSIG